MKDVETQQRFIMLRSQGWSFTRISNELNVARSTLINWSRKFQFEINNQRAIELEALREKLISTREARAQALGAQLRRVEQELEKRDLAGVSTGRLDWFRWRWPGWARRRFDPGSSASLPVSG